MNNSRRIGILVIILIIIAISLMLILPILNLKYTYTNEAGESFEFVKSPIGDITMHVLTTYVTYRGDISDYQYTIPLRNGPKSLEDISVVKGINPVILNKKYVYITLNPDHNSQAVLASIEIAKVIGTADYGIFKIPTKVAFSYPVNNTNSTETPIITCKNANAEIGVIELRLGNENKIYSSKECVILEAKDEESLIRVADRFVYNLLDVL